MFKNKTEPQNDKTNKLTCTQQRLRSAWASARSYQESLLSAWILSFLSSTQRRLRSDWADVQADLSLCWAYRSFCCFVIRRLKWTYLLCKDRRVLLAWKGWIIHQYFIFYSTPAGKRFQQIQHQLEQCQEENYKLESRELLSYVILSFVIFDFFLLIWIHFLQTNISHTWDKNIAFMAVWDFSVLARLSHSRIKLLSQTVNQCINTRFVPKVCGQVLKPLKVAPSI